MSISGPSTKSPTVPLPRGKRTKLKKAASKYADQDPADRAAALAKLGSATGAAQKAAAAAAQREREAAAAADKQRRRLQHFSAAAAAEAARHQARSGGGDGAAAASTASAASAASAALEVEENSAAAEAAEAEVRDAVTLRRLVGRPAAGDELVAAFAVCAPWSALAGYKFRAKMQPGTVKKGKAVREVLARWQRDATTPRNVDASALDPERVWPREAELIQGLKEMDVVGAMFVGKVRVMMSGTGKEQGTSAKGKGKAARGGKGSKRR
jgi:hypothetical protein